MRILLECRKPAFDPWQPAPEGAPLPPEGVPVLVALARFREQREALLARSGGVGVVLEPTDEPEVLAGDLHVIGLVALRFTAFGEGRCYTQARALRERLRYTGEVRATGVVTRDRLRFMERCGFDSFELEAPDEPTALAGAAAALGEISVEAQPAADGGRLLWRHAAGA